MNSMRVHYGSSIPPGLTAPTRGEVRVSIHRLVLQEKMIPSGIPHNECAVECKWWGEENSSSSGYDLPTTNTSSRGVISFVFPIKTLRPQIEQYFAHMAQAKSGLQLNIFAPASVVEKKIPVQVGIAMLNLEALTPRPAIEGWFTVVSAHDTNKCVGRIKVKVSVQYFNGVQTAVAEAELVNTHADGETTAEEIHQNSVPRSRTPQQRTKDTHNEHMSRPEAVENHFSAAASASALPPGPAQEEAPIQDVKAQQHNQQWITGIEDVLQRGLALRERMTAAARGTPRVNTQFGTGIPVPTPAVSLPAQGQPDSTMATELERRSGKDQVAQQSEVQPFVPQPFVGDRLADLSDATISESDQSDFVSSDDEAGIPRGNANDARAAIPVHNFHGLHRVLLELSQLSFTKVVSEVRFKVRPSSDIAFLHPVSHLTSPVFQLPWTAAIPFELCIASFTSQSKLVVECFDIRSRYDPEADANIFLAEKLVGVAVLGLFSQRQEHVLFHNPITGDDPARAQVRVEVQRAISEEDRNTIVSIAQAVGRQQADIDREPMLVSNRPAAERTTQTEEGRQVENPELKTRLAVDRRRDDAEKSERKPNDQHRTTRRSGKEPQSSQSKVTPLMKAAKSSQPLRPLTLSSRNSNARAKNGRLEQPPAFESEDEEPTVLVLELTIESARGLPLVAAAYDPNSAAPPSTFVAVEDVLAVDPTSSKTKPLPPTEWKCPDDRSDILLKSEKPEYGFQTRLQFPRSGAMRHDPNASDDEVKLQLLKSFKTLTLSLWNYGEIVSMDDGSDRGERHQLARIPIATVTDEEQFWANATMLGRVSVDLSTLRYLPQIDGWYHIVDCQDEILRSTIGQFHVKVKCVS